MTQDEIYKITKQADKEFDGDRKASEWVEYFAKLVAAKEREACAKVCEAGINNATDWDSSAWDQACENRSYAIRARAQADGGKA